MSAPAFQLPDEPDTRLWPLWRQVEHAILGAVRSGRMKSGDRLLGEHQLAEELGAHRHTVRRAIESLTARGVLEIRRGRGTFVVGAAVPYRIGRRSRFTENMRLNGREAGVVLLGSASLPAAPDVADALAVAPGTAVVLLELLRTGDGIPIVIARHFLPADRFPDFAERFAETRSITRSFASYGVVGYTRKQTRLSARLPTVTEAQRLAQSVSTPVLFWGSLNVDRDGRPINYDASVFAASRVDIVFDGDDA
jgi:GntR family phosphonate transport system transcriptional regulator